MARIMSAVMEIMDRPWEWGSADCCTSACDVFELIHGIDPMAPLRGLYSTEAGAARMIARRGGWLAMCDGLAVSAGLRQGVGAGGDIGIVRDAQGVLALGICTEGELWMAKTERGFGSVAQVIRAYTCRQ